MIRKLFLLLILTALLNEKKAVAQDWVNKMKDPSVNFYDVQQSFNKYWKQEKIKEKIKNLFVFGKKTEGKNGGFTMYKRWENYVSPRVYPSGDRSLIQKGNQELQNLIASHTLKSAMQTGGNWSPMGAFNVPVNGGGAGRLSCIRFHPIDQNIIFVGAPSGGLWKTVDGGATWTTNTDALPTLGINDIAIDPTNPNIMYLATGDVDASDTYGVGILKSINGGITWNITGLNWTTSQNRTVSRIIINPNDNNMLFAGTSNGVFKSIDAGITWTKVLSVNSIKDLELKPGDPSIIYAVSPSSFYRSTNTGNNFTTVSSSLPSNTTVSRIAIAVTPADPSYVYLLYSDVNESGFMALYHSTNSGINFTLQANTPNLLGYDFDGMDSGGNGWYTLSIAASPINKNEIVVGGVNIWKSYDGGLNWAINAHWYGDNGAPYVHADIHDLIYRPDGSACYAASDGGIFITTDGGISWQDKSDGLQIGQMYRLGGAATNANLVLQGWQDNGTNLYNTGAWGAVLGGDGMECFIDWSDPNYMYAEYQNGALHISSDAGAIFSDITTGISEPGEWITPWQQDPVSPLTIYAGFKNVWKSTDRGNNWTQISNLNSNGLTCLVVAKSNPQYIYASNGSSIYKTTDGGASWTTLSGPLGVSNTKTYIAVSETDPDKLWVTFSGYTANKKIYKSLDGGLTWMDLSGNLPNIPANCVVSQTGTNDGVYVGTDLGVYYRDNDLSSWMPYSNGLPNVIIDELEIHYGTSKLRAATYGRGLWETAIYNPTSTLPFANFAADSLSGCPGITVQFSDSTLNSPIAWAWSFPGGTPATSILQNPVVTYNTPGTYNNVSLIVTNLNGTDSITKSSYIAVSPQVQPLVSLNNNDSLCQGQYVLLSASNGNNYKWHPTNQTGQSINANTTGTYSVTVTDVFGCAVTSQPKNIYVFLLPTTPVITISGDTLTSSAVTGNQWYLNGTLIPNATDQTYVIQAGGTYKVKITDINGLCSSTSADFVGIEDEAKNGISYIVYPNPTNGLATLILQSKIIDDLLIEINDITGKVVYTKKFQSFTGRTEIAIDLAVYGSGVYMLSITNSKGNVSKKIVVY
ncbi:MAG: T9SS type A sorting domain-containing protein [Bacteroidia bacterium]|nr:T9SS type A sorting domain-containing protein [Bacteroidia bacterium]